MAGRKKTSETPRKPSGSILDLDRELWQAAVQLRGSIEPADYKRYVLPIIFRRFLSLRYDRRRAELEGLVAAAGTDYTGDASVLDDPDEYRAAGAFIVPPEARWGRIVKEVRGRDDVKVELDRVLRPVEDAYPERLRGLLPPIYGGSNMDAVVHDVVRAVRRNLKVDWTEPHRSEVKAAVKAAVKRVLRRRGARPEDLEGLTDAVMAQAVALWKDWPRVA